MNVNNLILDGQNIEFKGFSTLYGKTRTNSSGQRVECVDKFLSTVRVLIERFSPDNIYIAWDKRLIREASNFRKDELDGGYKAGRVMPTGIQEMFDQEPLLLQALDALGVRNVYPRVLEADDVISWLSRELHGINVIVSSDQDMYQLVNERVYVFDKQELLTLENFVERVGVSPENYKLYKAIKGDNSDNIEGLPGFAKKRSAKLAENWDKSVVSDEYKAIVQRNMRLMDLDTGFNREPGEVESYIEQLEQQEQKTRNWEKFRHLCNTHELKAISTKPSTWKNYCSKNSLIDVISRLSI